MSIPGNDNALITAIVEEFRPRYAPGGVVIYANDGAETWTELTPTALKELGVVVVTFDTLPDVLIADPANTWLFLIEAASSHGPSDAKRYDELAHLFRRSRADPIFVTAFATRGTMARSVAEISWETVAWIADEPDHLVHFNGTRLLGPYDEHM